MARAATALEAFETPDERRGVGMTGPPIPETLSDVSAAFLSHVLGAHVTAVHIERIGVDAGILGALARVHLEYAGRSAGPASIVVKLPTEAAENREIGMAFGFYERETRFYRELAPSCGLAVPFCYLASTESEHGAFMLVLEDLARFTQRDQGDGLTLGEAELAVEHLAGMHGRWWEEDRLNRMAWLPRIDGPGERDLSIEVYEDGWQGFIGLFGGSLTDEASAAGARIRRSFGEVIDQLGARPWTLVHGDFRADNLFFDFDGPARHMAAIDWQIALRAPGVFDVAYLLGSSLGVDDRRRFEHDLLVRYHDALCRAGVTGYSLEACVEEYRWSLMYATLYPVDAGSFELPTEAARAMVEQWTQRFFAAVVDLECTALLT